MQKNQGQLEQRVQERTATLSLANQTLHAEIAEYLKIHQVILEVQRKERERIGKGLHEGLAQNLTGISFKAKILQQKLSGKSPEAEVAAHEILDLLTLAITETKNLAGNFYRLNLKTKDCALLSTNKPVIRRNCD